MRSLTIVLAALASTLIIASSHAADQGPVIAVFTKNTTNPAYENFRLGADKAATALGARARHYRRTSPTMSMSRRPSSRRRCSTSPT
jgi:ribose transport system substrate-binding protein